VDSFVDGDLQLAKSVVARNDESERQYLFLVRILGTIAPDQGLAEMVNLGNMSMQMANEAVGLNGVKLSDDVKLLLVSLQKVCFEASDQALKAFSSKDVSSTEHVRTLQAEVGAVLAEIKDAAKNQPVSEMPQILAVTNLLRRVYDLSVSLADLV
jgi:hypothetical protein